jgi:hypothetical protein
MADASPKDVMKTLANFIFRLLAVSRMFGSFACKWNLNGSALILWISGSFDI